MTSLTTDEYGEVLNSPETFKHLAETIRAKGSTVIGWTDQQGSHLDILLVARPEQFGLLQRGLRGSTDLFVGIAGYGMHAFAIRAYDKLCPGYCAEKFGSQKNVTWVKVAELIDGVADAIAESEGEI